MWKINKKSKVIQYVETKKLFIDFNMDITYEDFGKNYKDFKNFMKAEVKSKFVKKRWVIIDWMPILKDMKCFKYKETWKSKYELTVEDYLKFLIIAECSRWDSSPKMQKYVWDLLSWDRVEQFSYCWGSKRWFVELFDDKNPYYDLVEYELYTAYIKYKNCKWNFWIRETYKPFYDMVSAWRKYSGMNNWIDFLDDVKYEEIIEEKNMFLYIIFSIIYWNKDLYLVYWNFFWNWFEVWIIDKKNIGKYVENWAFVFDVSKIVLLIFSRILKNTKFPEMVKERKLYEENREKMFQDIWEDAKWKHKISYNLEVLNWFPIFMSSKIKETDLNRYKELEEWIWEDGEIWKKKWKWKYNTITAKKQRVYWDKDFLKQLKKEWWEGKLYLWTDE